MAKKREVSVTRFNVNEQGAELKAKAKFSLKLFEGDEAQEHVVNYDLSMTRAKVIDLVMSTLVIDTQKIMRTMDSHGKVRTWTSTEKVMADIYPGRKDREPESPEKAAAKALDYAQADKELRKAMLAELLKMDEEDAKE